MSGAAIALSVALGGVGVGLLDPPLAVATLLGGALLVWSITHPELPLHLFLFALYTNAVVAVAGLSPAVAGAAVTGLLAIPLAHHLVVRREELRLDAVFVLMLCLLGVFAISASLAVDGATSARRMAKFGAEGVLVYVLVVNVVRTRAALRRVLTTLLVAGGLLGGVSAYQAVTGSHDVDYLGLARVEVALALDEGRADAERTPTGQAVVPRAGGPVNEPNRFAQILLVLLPLAVHQLRYGGSIGLRALALAAGPMLLAGVVLTYSRGAFLALVAMVTIYAWLGWVRTSSLVIAVSLLLIAAPVAAPSYYERIGSIGDALAVLDRSDRSGTEAVARGRTTETLAAVNAFLDHPVLGVGPGHYLPHYSTRYQLDPEISMRYLPEPRRAHSLYAEIAAESGATGLLIFLGMPLVLLVRLGRLARDLASSRPDLAHLAVSFGLAILGYLGTGVFLHLAFERYYWLLLALASAATHVLAEGGDPLGSRSPSPRVTFAGAGA